MDELNKKRLQENKRRLFGSKPFVRKIRQLWLPAFWGLKSLSANLPTSSAPPHKKHVGTEAPSKWQHVLRHVFKAAITRWKSGRNSVGGVKTRVGSVDRVGGGDFMSQRTGGKGCETWTSTSTSWFQGLWIAKCFTLFFFSVVANDSQFD